MAEAHLTEYIQRARQGDTTAIGDLYQQYHLSIFRYLYYRTGNQQVAEDLTSEVFIRMIRSLPTYRQQEAPFLAWLVMIARNLSIDYFRKGSTNAEIPLEEILNAGHEDVMRAVDHRLTSQTLERALQRLHDEQRDVIILRFVVGLPIAEVASALAKSEDAIKGLQRRGLAALRELLTEWEISYA